MLPRQSRSHWRVFLDDVEEPDALLIKLLSVGGK
jgi:hypothetical protein